ncbi:MAG: sigma-70 family RNA polymerase sigma factor [Planctomycetaceae bacterium]|nr:sigma-70 family RNA polymerase sigma factor [Planctomycetaceae bacterium]
MKKIAGHWLAAVIADVDAGFTDTDFRCFVAWILLDPVAAEFRSLLVEKLGVEVADFSFEDELERLDSAGLHRFCQDTDSNRLRQLLGSAKFIRLANERLHSDFLLEPQVQLSEQSTWGMELVADHTFAAATNEQLSDLNDRCRAQLVATAFRLCGNWQLAEDIVQGVFVRLMYSKPKSPQHLVNIAYRAIRQELCDKKRRKAFTELTGVEFADLDATFLGGCSPDDSPLVGLERKETQQAIDDAINRLSPRQLEIARLWLSALSYAEIAKLLDISVSAVGTTINRARERLLADPTLKELVAEN